jgi:hypothetical protein
MSEQPVIMVQIDDPQWTWQVLQSACSLARSCGGRIVLVKMVHVEHALYLGTSFGYLQLDERDTHSMQAYAAMVANHGLACDVKLFQYWDRFGAIRDAADAMGAAVVFAKPPHSMIPFWSDARFAVLRQHLAQQHLALYDRPVEFEQ